MEVLLIYIFFGVGPNNEGCDDHEEMNATISNSTVAIVEETDFTSVGKSENVTETTESNTVSFETSTEKATVTIDDNNSTQLFETDNTTTSDVEVTTANVSENSTTTVQENSTVTVVVDTTTDKVFETTTMEFVETTTEAETTTTTVKSKLCFDSEFECCPDGQTPAQVNRTFSCEASRSHLIFNRDRNLKDAIQLKNMLHHLRNLHHQVNQII